MIPARLEPLLRPDGAPVALARRFEAAGHELFLVGGSVRDALLGRSRADEEHDFATAARPAEVRRLVAGWADEVYTVGEAFGTVGVLKDGARLEITTFRAEVYRDDSRKPVVQYSDDLETDLSRRDFTVNATALRLVPAPEIIDPYGGLVDLGAGVLRTPLDPGIAFEDDPLRMLRLFRFVSVLGFRAAEDAVGAVRAMRERLAIVSAERVRDELDKLLVGEHVEAGLWGLVDSGLAGEFLPELTALRLQQDPIHQHKDVLAHTIAVVGRCRPDRILRLAALFHDVGKPDTRSFGPEGVAFHHHEVVGARLARHRLRELRYSKEEIEQVSGLVYLHLRPHTLKMGWTDRAVRRYVRDAGPLLERLNLAGASRRHHPGSQEGPGGGAAHRGAGGAHRRPAGAGGTGLHPAAHRRARRHGLPRHQAGPAGGRGHGPAAGVPPGRGPLLRGGGLPPGAGVGGGARAAPPGGAGRGLGGGSASRGCGRGLGSEGRASVRCSLPSPRPADGGPRLSRLLRERLESTP